MGYSTKVKESNDFKSFPRTLKDGSNRRRVLPGIHTCSEDGTWAKKYSTHTYAIPREDDPEKKDYTTFACVEVIEWVNRDKVVLETCPECVIIADQDDEYKRMQTKLKEELKSGVRNKDEVRKMLRPFIEWKRRHGRSFWWAVNVIDGDGKMFTEKWPNDVKKQYDALKKKLKDEENIGAILPIEQGVWVDIVKTPGNETGSGFPEYDVQVVMERQADGSKKEKLAPLAPESSEEAEKSCWDLNDPGVVTLTREQVKQLASSGDAPEVLRGVFSQSTKPKSPAPKTTPANTNGAQLVSQVTDLRKAVEAAVAPAPTLAPKVEDEDDKTLRLAQEALAAAEASRAAKRAAAVAATTKPPEPAPAPKVEEKLAPVAKPAAPKATDDDEVDRLIAEMELKD